MHNWYPGTPNRLVVGGFGEPADTRFLSSIHPPRWFYDLLRAL